MNTTAYATFLESMGHRVLRTEHGDWFDAARGIYMRFPFHTQISPAEIDRQQILGWSGVAVRYACPLDQGRASYQYICDAQDYGLDALSSNTRSKVRRGLARCDVTRIPLREVTRRGGLDVSRDTLARQGRPVPHNHDEYWSRYFSAADAAGCFEAWGALVDGQLAALLVICWIENSANLLLLRSRRDLLNKYPNNALLFRVLEELTRRQPQPVISYGWESLQPELESLDSFKRAMGFTRRPIGQRIDWNPWLGIVLQRPVRKILTRVAQNRSGENWSKLAGLLQWQTEQPGVAA